MSDQLEPDQAAKHDDFGIMISELLNACKDCWGAVWQSTLSLRQGKARSACTLAPLVKTAVAAALLGRFVRVGQDFFACVTM